jgi:hypothetical protein
MFSHQNGGIYFAWRAILPLRKENLTLSGGENG